MTTFLVFQTIKCAMGVSFGAANRPKLLEI